MFASDGSSNTLLLVALEITFLTRIGSKTEMKCCYPSKLVKAPAGSLFDKPT